MKILYLILLVVTFVLSINAQSKTVEALETENKVFKKNKCTISYDKFKDITNVISSMSLTHTTGTVITATFSFSGQTLDKPVKSYFVSITTLSRIEDTSLIFIANGERVNIGKAVRSNDPTTIRYLMDVYMQLYEFTPQQLEKFVSSEKVEFQIGTNEFSTKKEVSEKLKNLLTLAKLK